MSRSKRSGPDSGPARGNFTPPDHDTPRADRSADRVPPPAGGRLSPANWRVRTRLNAILLIPVLVALVVGGFNVDNTVQRWRQADDAVRTAKVVRAAADYAQALLDERDMTAVPLLTGDPHSPVVTRVRDATDTAARAFGAAAAQMPHTADLERRLTAVHEAEAKLPALRAAAYTAKLPGVRTEEAYVGIQHPLMEFANELGFGTDNLTSYGRTLYAISLTKAAESLTRSIGVHVLVERGVSARDRQTQLTALASYAYLENIALEEFQGGGTPQDIAVLTRAERRAAATGGAQVAADRAKAEAAGRSFTAPPDRAAMVAEIASGASPAALAAHGVTADSWMASATLAFDTYRSVESQLADEAEHNAARIESAAARDAVIDSAAVLLCVLAAFAVAAAMARSMSTGMRRLRTAALDVAQTRLPALVDQLSRTHPGRVDTRVAPIPINSADEIGEVARAFDQVHREAVRLASEQALLRGNVNAIFTNLSLRNQGLIQRQLGLISDLENNEADPDQLASLFQLDHLATRMRRNGENLLVLAGEEPGRRWNQPVPLVDVLRAAASEVESYERVEISGVPESEIHGSSVTDLVHLLAELLENATSFSSPRTRVKVTAIRLPDGRVVVEIHDMGIGLTAEDFADINHKLAEPPTVDAAVSRRMGLFVVGRLAQRHGIKVQMRPSGEQAGTTSLVMLPEAITRGGGPAPEGDFTVSRIVPEHRASGGPDSRLTAAELGFDDRPYETGASQGESGSLSRSLRYGGRRAALEAAAGERRSQEPGAAPYAAEESADGRYEQTSGHGPTGVPSPAYGDDRPVPYDNGYDNGYADPPAPGYPAPAPGIAPSTPGGYPVRQPEYLPPPAAGPAAGRHGSRPAGGWGPPPRASGDAPGLLPGPPDRVGYDAPDAGPAPRDQHWPPEAAGTGRQGGEPRPGGGQEPDENRPPQRTGQVREPTAGGITPSGLPKRVPRANLASGAAPTDPQAGPMVSRAPEDVRGRLSNLRRGVQRGRGAGSDTTPSPTDSQGPGPNHQER